MPTTASILALLAVRVAAVGLVTVATDATTGFCDLAWSAIVHGHVLHVLGWASATAEFTVATSKMEALAVFAREAAATSPDELVLAVDGYDVVVQASRAAITRQVRAAAPGVALGDTVLFSGENYCAPSFSLGGRPRCVAAYPNAAYHVNRRLACVRKNRGVLPQTACALGPPWDAAELMFPFANVGMIAATSAALNKTLAAYEAITAEWPKLASVADQGRFHALMRRRHIAAKNSAPGIRFAVDAHAHAFLNLCCPRLELFDQGVVTVGSDGILRLRGATTAPGALQWPGSTAYLPSHRRVVLAIRARALRSTFSALVDGVHLNGADRNQAAAWLAPCATRYSNTTLPRQPPPPRIRPIDRSVT